ncbi:MAG: hypothetical protein ACKVUT_13815 [Gaiella sp.]
MIVLLSSGNLADTQAEIGTPVDLICYERDSLEVLKRRRFDKGDACFAALGREWGESTRRVSRQLPGLAW